MTIILLAIISLTLLLGCSDKAVKSAQHKKPQVAAEGGTRNDSGKENNVWYRKGQIYFRVVNNLADNIGNAKTMRIGMVNGKPAVMTINGLVAKWDEVHNAAGSNRRLSYGVEVFRGSALPRGEVIKIVKSMKPVK